MAVQPVSLRPSRTKDFARTMPGRPAGVHTWLMPVVLRPFALVEVAVGMPLIIGSSWLMRPMDPLLFGFDFPWIWIFAAVFALRYGALLGMIAGLSILAAWLLFYPATPASEFPIMMFAGGFVLLLTAGHFADVWHSRRRRCLVENEYLKQRLTALTNNHYLLRMSHDRLEKEAFFGATTLRGSLKEIRRLCSGVVEGERLPGAEPLLQFLADAGQITNASIHAFGPNGLERSPLASIGLAQPLDVNNPLLQQCIQTRELTHIAGGPATQNTYLACVPLTSTSGRLLAVLVVRDMVFEALNASNLQFLLALLAYYGAALEDRRHASEILSEHPTCPHEFATELGRLGRLARSEALPSYLATIQTHDRARTARLEERIRAAEAQGACVWKREAVRELTFVVLYPMVADPDHLSAEWEAEIADTGARLRVVPVNASLMDRGLGNALLGAVNHG